MGIYEDEDVARQAMLSVAREGADMHEFVVSVSDDAGNAVDEFEDSQLANWAGLGAATPRRQADRR
jgi:hypothetical protein